MGAASSGQRLGWGRRWEHRGWPRSFLPAVGLLVLWVIAAGTHLLWFGAPPVEPRANLGRGCVLVCWETKATWHLIGAPTTLLGRNLNINGVPLTWYAGNPLWDISQLKDADFKLIIKAGVVQLPLLYPVVIAAIVPILTSLWQRSQREPWQCTHCRYDLRNTPGVLRCPECGNTHPMTEVPRQKHERTAP